MKARVILELALAVLIVFQGLVLWDLIDTVYLIRGQTWQHAQYMAAFERRVTYQMTEDGVRCRFTLDRVPESEYKKIAR